MEFMMDIKQSWKILHIWNSKKFKINIYAHGLHSRTEIKK